MSFANSEIFRKEDNWEHLYFYQKADVLYQLLLEQGVLF